MTLATRDGSVSIPDTARQLGVSIETIRRDINRLCAENKLSKVYGGAVPVKRALRRDIDYYSRVERNRQAKTMIGAAAAHLVKNGDVVMLDCGVSVQSIALAFTNLRDVTFITNSVPTASNLLEKHSMGDIDGRIILIGGEMNCRNRFASGTAALETLDRYYADIAFISCTSVSADAVSSYDIDESLYSAALMRRASTSVLIAESEKFGKNSVCRFAGLADFAKIITDPENPVPDDIAAVITGELIIAGDAYHT